MPADESHHPSPGSGPVRPPSQPSGSHYVAEVPLPEELQAMLGGRYDIECVLGLGGMGAVYKGMQVYPQRRVAIKVLRKGTGEELSVEDRFRREASAMAALKHPNIVQMYEWGDAGTDFLFISMELVEGGDLSCLIKSGGMTPALAFQLLPQICDAVQ